MVETKLLNTKALNRLKLGTKFMLIVGLILALVISSIFVWMYKEKERQIIHEVETQAEIAFEQIVITRRWNADYGGVYVEKRAGVESNPYLYEIGVDPDITDLEGKKYTLKNPAIMTRELSSYAEPRGVFKFHITSLKLLNPNNAPDDFERQALEEFEKGKKSVTQITVKDGTEVFQYMAPLYVEEACLKCHGHQGYKVGDVRGGISVFLPIQEAYLAIQETKKHSFFFALAIIFVLEAVLYYLITNLVSTPLGKLTKGAEEIGRGNLDYNLDIKSSDELGVLAGSFNTMAKELRKARDKLETRVKERTAKLLEANEAMQEQITERKKAEEQIKADLKEKEVLLQEIHHRVKNNLQVVSSLLELQSGYIKGKRDLSLLKESQNRIKSMALVHEKLYQSKDLANIDFSDYIEDLTNNLFMVYETNASKIALKIDVTDVFLGINAAIPCGLIINELVSNSLKHAFPEEREGKIEIVLRSIDEDEIELVVRDDGVGIPEDLDFRNPESMGLHLITILAEDQLQGKINLDRSKGTEFQIKFGGVKQ